MVRCLQEVQYRVDVRKHFIIRRFSQHFLSIYAYLRTSTIFAAIFQFRCIAVCDSLCSPVVEKELTRVTRLNLPLHPLIPIVAVSISRFLDVDFAN